MMQRIQTYDQNAMRGAPVRATATLHLLRGA